MKFKVKKIKEKGIALIFLVIIIVILALGISVLIKSAFDLETMGATGNEKIDINEYLGKYVEYTPKNGEYTADSKYTGSVNNNDFTTDTSLNWRIWNIDNEKLVLISDKPTSISGYKNLGAISLANCIGYNNCVKLLNDICKECYSNDEYNAVARSINADDIEEVLDLNVWNPEQYVTKKTNLNTYSGRKEYKVTICYPYIYSEEQFANIDENEIEIGINRSEQLELYDKTYLKAENSLNPMQTAWNKAKMNTNNFKYEGYYYLIFKEGFDNIEDLKSYFLASRALDLNENNITFDIFEVSGSGKIQTNVLFNSRGGSFEYWNRIRPMVEIPMDSITLDKSSDGMTKENSWKIINK